MREWESDLVPSFCLTFRNFFSGTQWNAGTNAYVFAQIGGSSGNCTTNRMTNPGNDREPGNTDNYTDEGNLGDCFHYGIGKPSDITFYISNSKEKITPPVALVNAWYPTVALVELSDGNRYSCSMEGWLGSRIFHGNHVPSMSCQLVNECSVTSVYTSYHWRILWYFENYDI